MAELRLFSGDPELARRTSPPWQLDVDLGSLRPQRLVAVGLDNDGVEVARSEQVINVPHPMAEVTIVVDGDRGVTLTWRHLMNVGPSVATITIDGRPLNADRTYRAVLPPLDPSKPHVVTARMQFEDGAVASAESVIEASGPSDFVRTEVTPVAVTVGAHAGDAARKTRDCFGF